MTGQSISFSYERNTFYEGVKSQDVKTFWRKARGKFSERRRLPNGHHIVDWDTKTDKLLKFYLDRYDWSYRLASVDTSLIQKEDGKVIESDKEKQGKIVTKTVYVRQSELEWLEALQWTINHWLGRPYPKTEMSRLIYTLTMIGRNSARDSSG